LSDLHFGPGAQTDVDWKVFLDRAERFSRRERAADFIGQLPRRPDFVIVSGDITIGCSPDGFSEFIAFAEDLIQRGRLPTPDRFVVVPGNHDVKREAPFARLDDRQRWSSFRDTMGTRFVRPWFPSLDPDLDTMLRLIRESFRETSAGGIQLNKDQVRGNT